MNFVFRMVLREKNLTKASRHGSGSSFSRSLSHGAFYGAFIKSEAAEPCFHPAAATQTSLLAIALTEWHGQYYTSAQ
ncbi:uncharacterized [Tachysurus ichikawai]